MTMPPETPDRPGAGEHSLHDLDLVAAYAAEDAGVDREKAAGLVSTCPDCRSEFEGQRRVMTWLSAAPVVSMTVDERSLLHDRIEQLIPRPAVVSLTERRARRQPGQLLFRIGAVAAGLVVIAGLGGVFEMGGDADGGSALQTATSDLAGESLESTVAAPTTTAFATFAAAPAARAMLTGGDLAAVQAEVETLLEQVAVPESAGAAAESLADATVEEDSPCVTEVQDRSILLTAESSLDGEPIIVFVVSGENRPDGADAEALAFQISDCSPVDLD